MGWVVRENGVDGIGSPEVETGIGVEIGIGTGIGVVETPGFPILFATIDCL